MVWRAVSADEVQARRAVDVDGVPRCDCSRPLKPDVVLFGELLPADAFARAEELAAGADLLLCIGSSLEVYPVAQLPAVTLAHGGAVALVTKGATPYDGRAAVRLGGDVIEELEAVLAALGPHRHARTSASARARPRAGRASRSPARARRRRARRPAPCSAAASTPARCARSSARRSASSPSAFSSESAASSATRSWSAAARKRPWSRSSRARSVSSAQTGRVRVRRAPPPDVPAVRAGRPPPARGAVHELARLAPAPGRDLLALAVPDPGNEQLAAPAPVRVRIGRRQAELVQCAIEDCQVGGEPFLARAAQPPLCRDRVRERVGDRDHGCAPGRDRRRIGLGRGGQAPAPVELSPAGAPSVASSSTCAGSWSGSSPGSRIR